MVAIVFAATTVEAQTNAVVPPQALAANLPARPGTAVVTPDWLVTSVQSGSSAMIDAVWTADGRALLFARASTPDGPKTMEKTMERLDVRTNARRVLGPGDRPHPSPDGRWIAYVRAENDVPQLWVMTSEGQQAHRIFSPLPLGKHYDGYGALYSFAWAPDSRRIAVGKHDEPATEAMLAPVRQAQADRSSAVEGLEAVVTAPPDGEVWIVDALSAKSERLLQTPGRVMDMQWYRDGSAVLFVTGEYASHYGLDRDRFTIRAMRVGDRQVRTIAAPVGMQQSLHPALSPDGRRVVFSYDADHPLYDFQISLGLASGIASSEVSPAITRLTREMRLARASWSPDGKTLYAIRNYGPYNQLYAIDASTGVATQLTRDPLSVKSYALSHDGRSLAWSGVDFQGRRSVRVATLRGNGLTKIREVLGVDAAAAGMALSEVREVEWHTPGYPNAIRGIVVLPRHYEAGRKYPLFVDMHGGGLSSGISPEGGLLLQTPLEWHMWAAKDYLVFVPDYRSSVQYGSLVVDQIREHQNELTADIADVMAGVDQLIAGGSVEETRMVALGHSAGGHRANWMTVTTHRFRGIVSKEGWADSYLDGGLLSSELTRWVMNGSPLMAPEHYLRESSIYHARGATTPTLFVMGSPEHGGADRRHSVEWLYKALKEQGVETRYVVYPDEGHVFTREANQRDLLSRVIPWVDEHLR
ncbi:MAG: prolyl oligopeptidase family serine peptidase [Gammaproteobacteria bacterium]